MQIEASFHTAHPLQHTSLVKDLSKLKNTGQLQHHVISTSGLEMGMMTYQNLKKYHNPDSTHWFKASQQTGTLNPHVGVVYCYY